MRETGVNPTLATTMIVVGFAPGQENCDGCSLCVDDAWCRGRKRCFITSEIIHFPKQRGLRCPLEFEEENDEQPV